MNLKNFFIPLLAVATMVSCSKDDDLGPKEPDMTPDCWFSLAVDTDTQTKTRADGDATDPSTPEEDVTLPRNIISNLAVFVYINGQYHASKDTALAVGDVTLSSVSRIPVKSGNVKVLVVANGRDIEGNSIVSLMKGKSLTDALGVMADLNNETHKHLSMSSEVFDVTLQAGKNNYAGFNGVFPNGDPNGVDVSAAKLPLKLYRNVARIQLSSLTLGESAYGTPKKFVLDTIFVANAKGASFLCPTDQKAWGQVEYLPMAANSPYWWFGACPGQEYGDSLTHVENPQQGEVPYVGARLRIPFDGKTSYVNEYDGGTSTFEPIELNSVNKEKKNTDANGEVLPIGNFFYVYENLSPSVGFQTLLVVRGDYTYIPNGSNKEVTEYNRYYTVVVNPEGTTDFTGVANHIGVKRNTKYSINLTISGSGSEKPYDPAARAYVGGTVKVLNWGVIEVNQSAD